MFQVTPTGHQALTFDDESWKPSLDDTIAQTSTSEISRSNEIRQSKTKRVKKYLKKCKNVLSKSSIDQSTEEEARTSSWYLEEIINEGRVSELDDIFEDAQVNLDLSESDQNYQVANVVHVKCNVSDTETAAGVSEEQENVCKESFKDAIDEPVDSSPSLIDLQGSEDGNADGKEDSGGNPGAMEEQPQTMVSEGVLS